MHVSETKKRILEQIQTMVVIDSHEHLGPEASRLEQHVDLFSLFSGYPSTDLFSAGMSAAQYESLFDPGIELEVRWKTFAPFWKRTRHTCYSKAILHTLKRFYGHEDVNDRNYAQVSAAATDRNKPGIYSDVLQDGCGIEVVLTNCPNVHPTQIDPDPVNPLLRSVMPMHWMSPYGFTWEEVVRHEHWDQYVDLPISTLDDYLEKLRRYLQHLKTLGVAAVKARAYPALHTFEKPDCQQAETLFSKLKQGAISKTERVNPLYYYVQDQAMAMAVEEGFVISVHTGYWGDFRDQSPLHLIPFVERYPQGTFDLFHMGYPWLREALMVAKGAAHPPKTFCFAIFFLSFIFCLATPRLKNRVMQVSIFIYTTFYELQGVGGCDILKHA